MNETNSVTTKDVKKSTTMTNDNATRVENEVVLLEVKYPEAVIYNPKAKEVSYNHSGSSLLVRLPDTYPEHEAPR